MANFKGRKSAARRSGKSVRMSKSPRWWDVVYFRRPHRRKTARCLIALRHGADPDGIAWPIQNKPHWYYW